MPDAQPPPVYEKTGAKDRLTAKLAALDDSTCQVLESIVDMLGRNYDERVASDSDIVVPAFSRNFRTRLQIHHATTEEPFKKKPFEFAFKAASIAVGRVAVMVENDVHPGHDVTVDGVPFSLKTEGGKSIKAGGIKISKFMEARWIRECRSGSDFLKVVPKMLQHLEHYERIIALRGFRVRSPYAGFRYDLIEIPKEMMQEVRSLTADDFTERTTNGTSTAIVRKSGLELFKVRLDGSVEKVTIESLQTARCKLHASWTVPILLQSNESEDE